MNVLPLCASPISVVIAQWKSFLISHTHIRYLYQSLTKLKIEYKKFNLIEATILVQSFLFANSESKSLIKIDKLFSIILSKFISKTLNDYDLHLEGAEFDCTN